MLPRSNTMYEKQLRIQREDEVVINWRLEEFGYDFGAKKVVRIGGTRRLDVDQGTLHRECQSQRVVYTVNGSQVDALAA